MKTITLTFLVFLISSLSTIAANRPNILWLSAEDINAHFGCYGDPHAITPHMDTLAKSGVRYTNVFTTAGVCAPCRSTIITGMYQTTIGTMHMRCKATLPSSIKPFPVYLRESGYYCTNNYKQDYQFKAPDNTWDENSRNAHWKNRSSSSQPFFAVFNYNGCHESGISKEAKYRNVTADLKPEQRQDPDKLTTLPPYYPDTPVTREDWKRNYELITAMDAWVGGHIADLKEAGLYDDTIIIFWSDHGVGLPRAKRWLYDSGTRVPMIVHIPEKWRVDGQGKAHTIDDQLISSIDFGPNVLNLAGVKVPEIMQGRAFLGPDLTAPSDYVYGARDRMDERYDIIRSVRDKRYRYIRNYEALKPYYQYMNTPEKGATMKELRRMHAEGKLPAAAALFMADRKPVEELYDLETDPHEIKNLASNPAYADKLKELREVHMQWVRDTRDLGLIPEPEIEIREQVAGSRYEILSKSNDYSLPSRLGEIAAKASDGPDALPDLIIALADKDPAVRYWAVTGVANIGKEARHASGGILNILKNDSSTVVRIAAARALLRMHTDEPAALAELEKALQSPEQWSRLHAAIALDEADEQARPAIAALKGALKDQPNKYIIRVANKALNDLLGTQNTVK